MSENPDSFPLILTVSFMFGSSFKFIDVQSKVYANKGSPPPMSLRSKDFSEDSTGGNAIR
jgi:hypothetical protein